jgi:hypothetical protein
MNLTHRSAAGMRFLIRIWSGDGAFVCCISATG